MWDGCEVNIYRLMRWNGLALQLHFEMSSESVGDHDSEVMYDWTFNRGDA